MLFILLLCWSTVSRTLDLTCHPKISKKACPVGIATLVGCATQYYSGTCYVTLQKCPSEAVWKHAGRTQHDLRILPNITLKMKKKMPPWLWTWHDSWWATHSPCPLATFKTGVSPTEPWGNVQREAYFKFQNENENCLLSILCFETRTWISFFQSHALKGEWEYLSFHLVLGEENKNFFFHS